MGLDDTATARTVSRRRDEPRRALARVAAIHPERWPAHLVGQVGRFAVVGVMNTALSLVVYKVCVDIGIAYPVASVIAFAVGAVNSYTFNRIWTFRAGKATGAGFLRYLVVQGVGLGVNELVLIACVEALSLDRLLAQAFALVVASTLMFVLNRQWAFAHARHGANGGSRSARSAAENPTPRG